MKSHPAPDVVRSTLSNGVVSITRTASAEAQSTGLDEAPARVRSIALTVLAVAASIALARYMQEVLIPFVLAGLVFYALDPVIDRLQRLHVPRAIGAALTIALVVGAIGLTGYRLQDDAISVIEELPAAAQKLRARVSDATGTESSLGKVQEAARELEETAAAASAPAPRGVERVQIEEPLCVSLIMSGGLPLGLSRCSARPRWLFS